MTKFTDIFGRKPGEAGDKIIPLTPISARSPGHPDTGTLNGTGIPIDIGSLGHENEMLRNLLSDAGRRIGELDELKLTFERLVSPFNTALRTLEHAKLHSQARAPWVARLRYAYADTLLAAGRPQDALEWFHRTEAVDADEITDAADRAAEVERSLGDA